MAKISQALREALDTTWDICTAEQREMRQINFGSAPSSLERRDAYAAETVRRYKAGEPMSKDAKRAARRLLRDDPAA